MNKPMKNREQEGVIRYLTQCYRKSSQRLKLLSHLPPSRNRNTPKKQQCDELTVALYESALKRCRKHTAKSSSGEFLDESADGWFYNYYPKSTFIGFASGQSANLWIA